MRKKIISQKIKTIVYLTAILLPGFNYVCAQDIPMNIGTRWYYTKSQEFSDWGTVKWKNNVGKVIREIIDTTEDGFRHIREKQVNRDTTFITYTYWLKKNGKFWLTYDSNPFPDSNSIVYRTPLFLKGLASDTTFRTTEYLPYMVHPFYDTLFGKQCLSQSVIFSRMVAHSSMATQWRTAEKIGVYYEVSSTSYMGSTTSDILTLTGLYIDGTVTGDTTFNITPVEIKKTVPSEFILSQNYPNPFNPTTNISFSIPESRYIKLAVYNMLGKEISTLVNEYKPSGSYTVQFNAADLPSGIYFYRIEAGNFIQTKKLTVLK